MNLKNLNIVKVYSFNFSCLPATYTYSKTSCQFTINTFGNLFQINVNFNDSDVRISNLNSSQVEIFYFFKNYSTAGIYPVKAYISSLGVYLVTTINGE